MRNIPRWLIAMVVVTVPLVLYNYPDIYYQLPETWRHRRGSLLMVFEMNYPTWWTGTLLLGSALLLHESAFTRERSLRPACLVLALLNAALSFDEIGSIHERVSLFSDDRFGSPWTGLAPFALTGIAAVAYGIKSIFDSDAGTRAAVFVSCGFLMFAFVVLQEYLEHHSTFPKYLMNNYGIKPRESRVFEEVTEMIGAMLVLTGSALVRSRGLLEPQLGFVLPRPANLPGLQTVLVIGLLLHCSIAFFLLPDSSELMRRGNPAGWYPSAVFFVVFCHAYWQFRDSGDPVCAGAARVDWLLLGLFCLLCSIGFLHNYGHFIGNAVPGIQKPAYFNPIVIYTALTGLTVVLIVRLGLLSRRHLMYLALLLLASVVEFGIPDRGSAFAASGIFAFGAASVFLAPRNSG